MGQRFRCLDGSEKLDNLLRNSHCFSATPASHLAADAAVLQLQDGDMLDEGVFIQGQPGVVSKYPDINH
jgi:hypothetical protein